MDVELILVQYNPLLGRPVIENNADDLCALISIEYTDEIFTIEPDACFKVLRHWTVIDWCQYDPSIDPVKGSLVLFANYKST